MCKKNKYTIDIVILVVCLLASMGLFIGGFFVPPTGVIDGSVLSAGGILLGFATLSTVKATVADGRIAKFSKGDIDLTIESKESKK